MQGFHEIGGPAGEQPASLFQGLLAVELLAVGDHGADRGKRVGGAELAGILHQTDSEQGEVVFRPEAGAQPVQVIDEQGELGAGGGAEEAELVLDGFHRPPPVVEGGFPAERAGAAKAAARPAEGVAEAGLNHGPAAQFPGAPAEGGSQTGEFGRRPFQGGASPPRGGDFRRGDPDVAIEDFLDCGLSIRVGFGGEFLEEGFSDLLIARGGEGAGDCPEAAFQAAGLGGAEGGAQEAEEGAGAFEQEPLSVDGGWEFRFGQAGQPGRGGGEQLREAQGSLPDRFVLLEFEGWGGLAHGGRCRGNRFCVGHDFGVFQDSFG